jgi:hypothetical protein
MVVGIANRANAKNPRARFFIVESSVRNVTDGG